MSNPSYALYKHTVWSHDATTVDSKGVSSIEAIKALNFQQTVATHLYSVENACCEARCSWLMYIDVEVEWCEMRSIPFQRSIQTQAAKYRNSKEGNMSFC